MASCCCCCCCCMDFCCHSHEAGSWDLSRSQLSQPGHNSAGESSSASEAQTFIFIVDLCMMSPHSSCCLSAPWWNMPESFAVIKKNKTKQNKTQRSWSVSGKSFLYHSKLPNQELLAEKLPNSAQRQLHFNGRDKLVEKQLKSHLCHKPTLGLSSSISSKMCDESPTDTAF